MIFGYIASLFICNADIPFFVLAINAGLWCYLLVIRPECSLLATGKDLAQLTVRYAVSGIAPA
jgi:hypothetical protein